MTTRVETKARVRIYEVDREKTGLDAPELVVETHAIDQGMVVIRFPGAARAGDESQPASGYAVHAEDLRLAIQRCSK
jgi:hypothetical protein